MVMLEQETVEFSGDKDLASEPRDVEFVRSLAAKILAMTKIRKAKIEDPISKAERDSGESRDELRDKDLQRDGTRGSFGQEVSFLHLLERIETEMQYASGEKVDLYTIDFTDFFKAIRFTDLANDQQTLSQLKDIQSHYQYRNEKISEAS